MKLSCVYDYPTGPRWTVDGRPLPDKTTLGELLSMRRANLLLYLEESATGLIIPETHLAPIDPDQEVWACGVTYLRSRIEREAESSVADVYARVYDAARPEVFFKSVGWRVVGDGAPIRIRCDSDWNVPEPELTLVVNRYGEIVGFTVGNDVSSRSIEGENPLYLPQAKTYDGSCALGPEIVIASEADLDDLAIELVIERGGERVFEGHARTSQMKRPLSELVAYATRELTFPGGLFLMTGTGIVPAQPFTLLSGDVVTIRVGELTLCNPVA